MVVLADVVLAIAGAPGGAAGVVMAELAVVALPWPTALIATVEIVY